LGEGARAPRRPSSRRGAYRMALDQPTSRLPKHRHHLAAQSVPRQLNCHAKGDRRVHPINSAIPHPLDPYPTPGSVMRTVRLGTARNSIMVALAAAALTVALIPMGVNAQAVLPPPVCSGSRINDYRKIADTLSPRVRADSTAAHRHRGPHRPPRPYSAGPDAIATGRGSRGTCYSPTTPSVNSRIASRWPL
jgi:hypothetical protein